MHVQVALRAMRRQTNTIMSPRGRSRSTWAVRAGEKEEDPAWSAWNNHLLHSNQARACMHGMQQFDSLNRKLTG